MLASSIFNTEEKARKAADPEYQQEITQALEEWELIEKEEKEFTEEAAKDKPLVPSSEASSKYGPSIYEDVGLSIFNNTPSPTSTTTTTTTTVAPNDSFKPEDTTSKKPGLFSRLFQKVDRAIGALIAPSPDPLTNDENGKQEQVEKEIGRLSV
ncbi:MAG TPA: hypothetical protein VHZ76_01580 [Gammaproteobacteria bacterium]|jgi:hypothetical protein|nr:hypothetical protein [Gammaproteobacteria bacterium]